MKLQIDQYDYLDSASLFAKVADQPWAVFLDSGVINSKRPVTKHADFDVLAIKPETTLVTQGQQTEVTNCIDGTTGNHSTDPLELLKQHLPNLTELSSECAYLPGAIGYFSYDLARQFEVLPELTENDEQLPEMAMGVYSAVVVVDHLKKRTLLLSLELSRASKQVLTEWRDLIENTMDEEGEQSTLDDRLLSDSMQESLQQDDYLQRFNKVRQYTVDGDCYQVNLAKRFSAKVTGDAWQTYSYLRHLSPAPYGAYINLPFAQVLSNSPESFIQCRNSNVVTSPIKGTSPRDHSDSVNDKRIADNLFNSPKDRAENLMIVDLMRNDLSRCCELGSVKAPKLFAVHSFANVHHLISTITGTLKRGLHSLDLLRSCFPGGSITGAPKIRAMEIIEELEVHRRGLYCGAIGYVGMDGTLETNIAIRTIVVKNGVARFSAGGGLVIDSDVDQEYQEIIDKASMMKTALFENRE